MSNQSFKQEINQNLFLWYQHNKRHLPWRSTKDPYAIWVSEIMLQQTRVEAVKTYYDRWMTVLPTVTHLAEIDDDLLYKLWQGLGYYARVRNMKKAAVMIVSKYHEVFPTTKKELLELPGIGDYTSSAIASISFGEQVASVDGNVLRVVSRLFGFYDDITKKETVKKITNVVEELMLNQDAGKMNQAWMELGALICIPNGMPKCNSCPLQNFCIARAKNIISEIPVKPQKKSRKNILLTVLLLEYNDKWFIHKRSASGLLANLWEYINLENHLSIEEVISWCEQHGMIVEMIEKMISSKHIFTHLEWNMKGYHIRISSMKEELESTKLVSATEIKQIYSIPSAFQIYTDYILNIVSKDTENKD